jgi:alpha-D-ribose 1-methylphosphonate 5-triphosphate synthase subunit PhnL
VLELNNLSKSFHLHLFDGKVIQAFDRVSFAVQEQEFIGLSGPSGSGKSSILKCIYRTYLPSGGEIWYDSRTHGRLNLATLDDHAMLALRRHEIGYISQFLNVIPRISAVDVVAEPLLSRNRCSEREARRRAAELLERLEIPAYLFDAHPATFSGGEQQRVNVARAVIWKPRLLLLDEPTASLDKRSVSLVVALLNELKKEGMTMIGIFHDASLHDALADKRYHLRKGDAHHVLCH